MTRLNCDLHPLLTADVLSNLFQNSIFTTSIFVRKKTSFLASITGLQYKQILKLRDGILFKFSSPLKRGDQYYQELVKKCFVISSGIKAIDLLLEGGFMTGNIYELHGLEACGKTQLCMSVSLNFCLNTPYQVLFIDTKYDISVERFLKILITQNKAPNYKILNKIKICHVTNACNLLNFLHCLKAALLKGRDTYLGLKFIIIDSLSVVFQIFSDVTESLSVLNHVTNILRFIATECHIIIIVTNFVSSWTVPNYSLYKEKEEKHENKVQQGLGKYWAHIPNVIINIKKNGCLDKCHFIIIKSTLHEVGKAVKATLTDAGIV